ncbi:43567_t:CDS:1, partial [Gigaspora margarita]
FMKDFKNIQDNRPSNKNIVNLFSRTSKKISISSIKFGKQSHKFANNFSQIASKEKNLCNILKDFEVDNNMLFKLEDKNDMSFEVAADNNEEFFEILQDTLPNFKNIAKEIEPSKS